MATAVSFPLNYLREEEVVPAHRQVVIRAHSGLGIAFRGTIPTFKLDEKSTYRVKYVVKMRPRRFNEVANHFMRVAKPIDWPVDEADVD